MRDEVTAEWDKLYDVGLHDLYCTWNIISMIKWRRVRSMNCVACVRDMRNYYRWVKTPREYAVAGTPYTVDIILNWIRFSCLGFAAVAGRCEHSNEPLGPIQ